ncbi:toll/interleukin-1 receptor domain-containing protein [Vibrio cholerae]|uniref:toll/interleukin-1 receptor domain-containing protein n=3 Tax=Vibrionaceae TaxID=641 RepID=UPI0011F06E2B|nr:toll/interleukin-1 receptor domain-containing protein [Vibrio cholerae]TYW40908.1 toll/interleukin-1 receptor domain-containing protein [Vibrio cholerae]
MYDVFICHASEDKEVVATPLFEALAKREIKVFIDNDAIDWGDSLVSKINTALKKSKYVIAIVSDESVKKSWPMKELNTVLAAEISSKETKLLPLMVGDGEELLKEIPLLGDKLFVNFNNNIEEIADKVEKLLQRS